MPGRSSPSTTKAGVTSVRHGPRSIQPFAAAGKADALHCPVAGQPLELEKSSRGAWLLPGPPAPGVGPGELLRPLALLVDARSPPKGADHGTGDRGEEQRLNRHRPSGWPGRARGPGCRQGGGRRRAG